MIKDRSFEVLIYSFHSFKNSSYNPLHDFFKLDLFNARNLTDNFLFHVAIQGTSHQLHTIQDKYLVFTDF